MANTDPILGPLRDVVAELQRMGQLTDEVNWRFDDIAHRASHDARAYLLALPLAEQQEFLVRKQAADAERATGETGEGVFEILADLYQREHVKAFISASCEDEP